MFPLQAQAEVSIWSALMPFVIMMVVFYLFLIRPQQVQQRKRREMLAELRRGDKIITVGGIFGEIVAIRDDILTVRIAEGVDIKLTRNGVGSKRTGEQQES